MDLLEFRDMNRRPNQGACSEPAGAREATLVRFLSVLAPRPVMTQINSGVRLALMDAPKTPQ